MTPLAKRVLKELPGLRRYASAVMGAVTKGDRYFELCLETLLEEPSQIIQGGNIKFQLFKLFHETLDAVDFHADPEIELKPLARLNENVVSLPDVERQLLLLVTLESFLLGEAADILRISTTEARLRLCLARCRLKTSAKAISFAGRFETAKSASEALRHDHPLFGEMLMGRSRAGFGAAPLAAGA